MNDLKVTREELVIALTDALETLRVVNRGEAFHPRIRPSTLRAHIAEIELLLSYAQADALAGRT